jgi:fluoride exporter
MWKNLLFVFLGGGLGSVLRSLVGRWVTLLNFPLATFLVNVTGCFLIGLFYALFARQLMGNDWRLLLTVGFCGGFTTFSTFSNEGLHFLRSGQFLLFAVYVLTTVFFCLLAVWLGDLVGKNL